MSGIRTALTPVGEIFALRHAVLRPGLPAETAVFPEDSAPGTFHVAAYDEAGAVRGCVTFVPEPLPGTGGTGGTGGSGGPSGTGGTGEEAYRFRGMASDSVSYTHL